MLETVIGWTCLIVGVTGLLIKNINWQAIISKIKERK